MAVTVSTGLPTEPRYKTTTIAHSLPHSFNKYWSKLERIWRKKIVEWKKFDLNGNNPLYWLKLTCVLFVETSFLLYIIDHNLCSMWHALLFKHYCWIFHSFESSIYQIIVLSHPWAEPGSEFLLASLRLMSSMVWMSLLYLLPDEMFQCGKLYAAVS